MVAVAGLPIKRDMELKLPILPDEMVPKKAPGSHKILAIKLPLDIDIRIHHDHHRGIVPSLVALVLLFVLPFFFMYSYHQQMQMCKYQLAELQTTMSEIQFTTSRIITTSMEMQNTFSDITSLVNTCDCKGTKGKGIQRRKRATAEGQNVAANAENELKENTQDSASNDTMRGNVTTLRRLLKLDRKRKAFGGVRAAHFKGLLPEKVVEAGQIGPWYEDQQAVGDFGLQSCKLRDRGVKLVVNETGLYLIYAQVTVYYLTSKSLNSYSINVSPGNKGTNTPIAFCSANASVNDQGASEVSCFTSIVRRLQAGDAISLQQQERQRRLVMRDGHSFVGLVRLS